jgi:hypothetical protein
MPETLTEMRTERVVVSGDQLPQSLSEYDGIEKVVDEHSTRYFSLKRGKQLSAEAVESAFKAEGRSLEDVILPSTDLEQLRQEFDDYKTNKQAEIQEFEDKLRAAEEEQERLQETIRQLRSEADIPEPIESENRLRWGWNQVTGRVGNFVLGAHSVVENGTHFLERRGRKVVVTEEVVDGYPESSRRAGARALAVGAIAVGATALVTWWLTKNGNDPNTVHESIDIDINNDGIPDVTEEEAAQLFEDKNNNGVLDVIDRQKDILSNQERIFDRQGEIMNNPDWGLKAVDNEVEAIQRQALTGGELRGGFESQSLNFYGDTIWYHVEDSLRAELGYQPSVSQIHHATQRILEINGLSWADARHLPLGYDFKIPANLVR